MRVLLIAVLLLASFPAQACLWAGGQRQVLFTTLPPAATEHAVIAQVRVDTVVLNTDEHVRTVITTVIKPIKGTKKGERIGMATNMTSCTLDNNIKAGAKFFIAGDRVEGNNFYGVWDGLGQFVPYGSQ